MGQASEKPLKHRLDVLSRRLVQHRLNRNLTQVELAREAGVSRRTLARLESGESTQLDSFLRILGALGLEAGLDRLIPDVPESPIQQLERSGRTRKRATGRRKHRPDAPGPWSWADDS